MSANESLLLSLLESASRCQSLATFLPLLATDVSRTFSTDQSPVCASVHIADSGNWTVIAHSSEGAEVPPVPLLAEAADQRDCVLADKWFGIPLPFEAWGNSPILMLHGVTQRESELRKAAEGITFIAQAVQQLDNFRRQTERLTKILQISSRWHGSLELIPLLEEMARASVDFLDAERATIFLWDRKTKTLVGRPALGIDEGELRVPESAGIVGQVVQSGQPSRLSQTETTSEASQLVEAEFQFVTRNLVCVPLTSHSGKVLGAFEVLNKRVGDFDQRDTVELRELAIHAAAAIDACHNLQQLLSKSRATEPRDKVSMIGNCEAIQRLRTTIQRVAPSDLAILILGENGTGKEIAARMIHQGSDRLPEPFLAVNCAAMTESLLESELFGHEKGAFTDAHQSRKGKFELAAGGTLFLDEIAELRASSQAKLLRVLEEKTIVRVGGTESIATDVRIVAATNRDLGDLIRRGAFREDLFFRLNSITLEMPPLRERGNDVLRLAAHFLVEFSAAAHRSPLELSTAAANQLRSYHWPGNVRELRNMMERVAYLSTGNFVEVEDLQLHPAEEDPAKLTHMSLADATREFQIEYIDRQIRRAGGNVTKAAKQLGMHRSNLYRKMGQLGMSEESDHDSN